MNTADEELWLLLKKYDELAGAISEVLSKPHALDNIRLAVKKFYEETGKYPREIHEVLETYLKNCRRQEMFGQISRGGD